MSEQLNENNENSVENVGPVIGQSNEEILKATFLADMKTILRPFVNKPIDDESKSQIKKVLENYIADFVLGGEEEIVRSEENS